MRYLLLFLFLLTTVHLTAQENTAYFGVKPKNIILLIGDGMGLSQVSAGMYYGDKKFNFERFNTIGLIKTSSASDLVTDSAAGATAFASGIKTYNGAIGVTTDTIAVPTIVEQVSRRGKATGIISTSSVVHATPACFYAHVKQRRLYQEIASWLPKSDLDFIAGGGREFFYNRKDKRDIYEELEKEGFEVITDKLPTSLSPKKQIILLAQDGMPKMMEKRGEFLPKATILALKKFSTERKGFFLMIEGSQIDWGGHDNNAEYLIGEQLDFDKTVGIALDFAKLDKETLVIVTADHETGGFTLAADDKNYNKIKPSFSTGGHSATLVPVFAQGPGASLFGGMYENTEIYTKMISLLMSK